MQHAAAAHRNRPAANITLPTVKTVISSSEVIPMMNPGHKPRIAILALAAVLLFETATAIAQEPQYVRVLVALRGDWQYEGNLRKDAVVAQRAAIAQAQSRVIAAMRAERGRPNPAALARVTRTYLTVPGLALELRHELVDRLRQLPDVALVYEDQVHEPFLVQSTPVVGSHLLNDAAIGVDGNGQVVAIIDTGVDRNHPFLGTSRFVANACFSDTSWFSNDRQTLCPNGEDEQFGGDAGENCTGASGCDHGTHVAGIVGGYLDSNGNGRIDQNDQKGVAPRVKFITMQVFHRVNKRENCDAVNRPTPCVLTFSSDYTAALDRVNLHRDDHQIAAANLSLGGGRHTGHCDHLWLEKWAIDDLRSRGTATVVATGNSGFSDAIGHPACISTAISVGNTANNDTFTDSSGSFNGTNTSSITSLLAPGTQVVSSVPGTGFLSKTGTSMAAPHVAGIWALMKQDRSARGLSTTVDSIVSRLRSTGRSVTRAGITIARVDAVAALERGIVEVLPTFSVASMQNGSQLVRQVNLRRRNYSGALRLDGVVTSGDGTHLSISFSNNQITGSSVDIGISSALVANGTYGVRLTGVANQVSFIPASVSVVVTQSQLALAAMAFNLPQVTGGTSLVGMGTLNGPTPATGFTVQVNNSSPSATTLPSPFPLAFAPVSGQPLGQATFTVGTRPVHADTTVAMGVGGASGSFVVRAPRIQSFAIEPQILTPGQTATGSVTLNGQAPAASATGLNPQFPTVATASSSSAVAAVSGTAIISASTSTSFPVTAANVPAPACAAITAAFNNQAVAYVGVTPAQGTKLITGPAVITIPIFSAGIVTLRNDLVTSQVYTLTSSSPNFGLSTTSMKVPPLGTANITVTPGTTGCAMVTAMAPGGKHQSVLIIAGPPIQG